MKSALRDDLERVLPALQAEPGLDALEERVLDAGHLEEDDYDVLLERRVRGSAYENLRRHLLFCEVCATELLRRRAPETAQELDAEGRRVRNHRLFYGIIFGVVAVVATLAVWVAASSLESKADTKQEAIFRAAIKEREFTIKAAWAGTGRQAGKVAGPESTRLHIKIYTEPTPDQGVWIYAFHIADGFVTPLSPVHIKKDEDAGPGTYYPASGWRNPGHASAPHLLVLAATRPLPTLRTLGDRRSFANTVQRHLASGSPLSSLPAQFEMSGPSHQTRAVLLDVKR